MCAENNRNPSVNSTMCFIYLTLRKHYLFLKCVYFCVCAGNGSSGGDPGWQHGGWVLPPPPWCWTICPSVDLLHNGGDQQLRVITGTQLHKHTQILAGKWVLSSIIAKTSDKLRKQVGMTCFLSNVLRYLQTQACPALPLSACLLCSLLH